MARFSLFKLITIHNQGIGVMTGNWIEFAISVSLFIGHFLLKIRAKQSCLDNVKTGGNKKQKGKEV